MKYVNYAAYTADKAKILALRPQHRQYLSEIFKRGNLVAAGPFPDDSGAVFIYEAGSDLEAFEIANNDPFARNRVFERFEVKAWNLVFCNPDLLRAAAP